MGEKGPPLTNKGKVIIATLFTIILIALGMFMGILA